ncbi:thymidine phosphorylase [Rubrivivax benzoatilyticus]|uniref:Thymidine phosphorylase n=1 Tax=Rubrivivax benzoatilyticus TaxID=316997 RepID=A0ABX0HW81_9BURK|nr:thymidine phosphorylase [Rubrivivax benzoatilyticus]EGJ09595.1 thymidine phosphorylase [Rubrivivax benzoatilyticus JA2 = ATCC BAA-35]NHK98605.1 thymidine phosphorylase [Rubrivivax benzoatilyticus]NHL24107.1 thymidine phosphorylase [Rubrivivax benzoatilyticus]
MLAAEVIANKRDGHALSDTEIRAFVAGLTAPEGDARWSDAQVAALAMAVLLRGMDRAETVALTQAMTDSGERLRWAGFGRPVLDKHSTGGLGDKTSLLLAPIVAACGGLVPMISGRGLGHTGGTLDKLEALPGYGVNPSPERLHAVLRAAGCAIVGASERLAPADRRLYAIRDVTATVESLPLITASILSKKLAAGLDALVLDVKLGSGAFMRDAAAAQALATSLVDTARGAGLAAAALVTDMNQVLGRSAGNALEVAECLALLRGEPGDARLVDVTLGLAARLLVLGGLQADEAAALAAARQALASGAAAERFAAMVAGLGGPADVLKDARLATAPVIAEVPAPRDGVVSAIDARALGYAIVELGGGRRRGGDVIDPRVGLDAMVALGETRRAGEPLARVHAADEDSAARAVAAVQAAVTLADTAPPPPPWLHQRIDGDDV